MFERESALEPGIEHPVWENEIWRRGFVKPLPHRKAVVLPDSVNDDAIKLLAILPKPSGEGARVTIVGQALTESVHCNGLTTQPR